MASKNIIHVGIPRVLHAELAKLHKSSMVPIAAMVRTAIRDYLVKQGGAK